ncbi:LysR family transcriptional regulator [Mesorhizobium sp. M1A.F.Ca.ET.072.01.1.1]|uniref:LysR substrate-binding domain-containing protein n=1 Tax=Mesorhizobium sp. M1A.F.Ca.ET.072.01.1.1 TaxID=2496753 RepID=UPI000FD4E2FE|nr:LysR substrate-binding domain-containing protein [Mesorhizobium sp. M1A.F.Ca.ET.072.01.1.1]RUW44811.1 LysR family transcriptional regulator [Mesorhizobium sp. M1A.F.Ca.ET.072.01.1.1]TIU98413.1 MAG: LysR family transcriptional regulator [Mesorhizobium sp.]
MVRRYYDLPSLTALAVFEASARHLSFKLAASELNVTPGAVSRQIKAVEEEIGVPLFVRMGSGVILTSAGEDLYAVLANGFSKASEVVRTLKRGDRSKNVTIACSDAFASMWLIPRMPGFWRRHPEIAVDHLISDNSRDFRRSEVELRIRYGFGSWPDETTELFLNDVIYPVCGPHFAQVHRDATAESLSELPLLHVNWVDPDWADWDEVLRRAGIPHGTPRGRRFGKFFVTLQAAQANQGVAVGWHRLVQPLIEEGKLVRITDLEMPAPGGYYLTWNDNRTLSPAAELFREWLREISAQERAS